MRDFAIDDICVYNLITSIYSAGFSRSVDYSPEGKEVNNINNFIRIKSEDLLYYKNADKNEYIKKLNIDKADFDRFMRLGTCKIGSGHDSFMKGTLVTFVITAPQYWWAEAKRYHFFELVSSESTMYNIKSMKSFMRKSVLPKAREALDEAIDLYDKGLYDMSDLASNIPSGIELAVEISTNYTQLKTIYFQRTAHKLKEWNEFNEIIEGLPLMNILLHNVKK